MKESRFPSATFALPLHIFHNSPSPIVPLYSPPRGSGRHCHAPDIHSLLSFHQQRTATLLPKGAIVLRRGTVRLASLPRLLTPSSPGPPLGPLISRIILPFSPLRWRWGRTPSPFLFRCEGQGGSCRMMDGSSYSSCSTSASVHRGRGSQESPWTRKAERRRMSSCRGPTHPVYPLVFSTSFFANLNQLGAHALIDVKQAR